MWFVRNKTWLEMKNFFCCRTLLSVLLNNFFFSPSFCLAPQQTDSLSRQESTSLVVQATEIPKQNSKSFQEPVAISRGISSAAPLAEWSIMIYLQARNNLAPFAAANLDALAAHAGNPQVNFLAQWDQPKKPGCWRYKVEAKNVSLVNYVANENPTDIGGKLVDFVSWAKTNYPAKNYALVFWNHGIGIIDPCYGSKDLMGASKEDPLFLIRKDAPNFKFFDEIFDVYVPKKDPIILPEEQEALLREVSAFTKIVGVNDDSPSMSKPSHRGILFDEENQSYVNSQDLESSLKKITALLGKKLSIIGFDACFMSNWEIACQVEKYADFMVGSEELELPKGWDYKRIGEFLANNSCATPEALACTIARCYGQFYNGQTNMYTQTAIRLDKIQGIKTKFNEVLLFLEQLSRDERVILSVSMQEARRLAVQLTAKFFIDLGSWISVLVGCLKNKVSHNNLRKNSPKVGLEKAIVLLEDLWKDLSGCILEHITSGYLSKLTGLSIYFPVRSIEASYGNCNFASGSNWLSFVKSTNIF